MIVQQIDASKAIAAAMLRAVIVKPMKRAKREGSQVSIKSPNTRPSHKRFPNLCLWNTISEINTPEIANNTVNITAIIISL